MKITVAIIILVPFAMRCNTARVGQSNISFEISANPELETTGSGRIFFYFNRTDKVQPRFSVNPEHVNESGLMFAKDVDWNTDKPLMVNDGLIGFPLDSLNKLDSGDYFVQALYDTDTTTSIRNAPGNLFSDPIKVHINSKDRQTIKIVLDKKIEATKHENSQYIRYVKIESKLLSNFWNRPMYVEACVLLPAGYDSSSSKKYPVRYNVGGYGERCSRVNRYVADSSFRKMWLSPASPKMLMVFLDSNAPFGDCYQMNSENNGPYKDVLLNELIPFIEREYHALGTPASRFLDGGSTGGWVPLALQIFNPDYFNGCWSFYSDPVDFRFFQLVNIYSDKNAFVNRFGNENASARTAYDETTLTMRNDVRCENVQGQHNSYITSGNPWGGWNAVYSPRGKNGLPAPIWDPNTGVIDTSVANHWKRWDLRLYLAENWNSIGAKLQGKLHIWMGDMDTYFLNASMRLMQDFLAKTESPRSDAQFVFGPMQIHGWQPLSELEIMQQMIKRVK